MAYIDYTYYTNVYKGVPIPDADTFSRLSERATEIIDQLTGYAIQDLAALPLFTQEQVKRATAAQVEYFALAGYSVTHGVSEFQNVKLGDFSYSTGGAAGGATQNVVSPAVLSYLRPTGLLYIYRGVTVCD